MPRFVLRDSYRWKAENACVLEVGEVGGHTKTMEVTVWYSTSPITPGPPASPPPEDRHDPAVQLAHLDEILNNPLGLDRSPTYTSSRGWPSKVAVQTMEGTPTLTPSTLQRLPWGKWLAAADAVRRGDFLAEREAYGIPISTEEKRPGRKGHNLAHYKKVAARYTELRAAGDEAPAKTMAQETSYNENTVRGWIRRCRELELLPPGRPGRAG